MATKKSLGDLMEAELKGKTVFLHADLDVPLGQEIADDTRIRASVVPTIKFLTDKGAKVILASHPGRPKGVIPDFSSKSLAPNLSELLQVNVVMANDFITEDLQQLAASLPDGGVVLLENARFLEDQEKDGPEFAKKLASVADIYVHDASAHRHGDRALLPGKTLSGVFAWDINDGIDTVIAMKHGDNTGHHITDDNDSVIWNHPAGKSRRTLPDDFAYEITNPDGSVVTGEISTTHGGGGGRASTKVHEGKGLPGVFYWNCDNGPVVSGESKVEDKYTEHI